MVFQTQHLYQNDPEWRKVPLGGSRETIGNWGGLLTSITMILNGIGYDETPVTVNDKLKKAGGFFKALPEPSSVPYLWANCVYKGLTRCEENAAPLAEIDAAVEARKPVILEVDSSKQIGVQTHFVLVKEKAGDDYVVYDPDRHRGDDPDKEVLLTKRYKFNGGTLTSEVRAVLWFDFLYPDLPPAPKFAKVPAPADKYTLFASAEGLILRAKPAADRSSYPLKRLFWGTRLTSLEHSATTRAKLGGKGMWIRVQDPEGDQGYVSAEFVNSIEFPALVVPLSEALPSRKKWCLKNVSLESPRIETWDRNKHPIPDHRPARSLDSLQRGTIVHIMQSNVTIPGDGEGASWSGVAYEETYYDKGQKDFVTSRVTGWLRDSELDEYCEEEREEFRESVVPINYATRMSTDAAQYLTLEEQKVYDPTKIKHNLCGQFCVARVAGKGIDTVLSEWGSNPATKGLYESTVGGNADKPLTRQHIDSLLKLHIGDEGIGTWQRYTDEAIPLVATDRWERDLPRQASQALQEKLEDYSFITNVRINLDTGVLVAAQSRSECNHWVVLDRITRNGLRVEIYNPFPNRREEYSFGEFYRSMAGKPNSGWWVKRDKNASASRNSRPLRRNESFQRPAFNVAIDNQTAEERDAEQYMYIRGEGSRPKTKLCGEFSVTFLLSQSLDGTLAHWLDRQAEWKKEGKQPATWELAALLQAYGFNRRKYPKEDKQEDKAAASQSFKSFSIDTVLEYWKGVQPDLYNSILGGNRNEPTGPEDLITILKAYGYVKDKKTGQEDYSYYRPGSQEPFGYAPARDAQVIGNTHYLLAGVNIHGTTGALQPSGVPHWVVVTRITPRGTLVGGNGGWVELYNPFTNSWEEYSYREFWEAFRGMSEGTTLWIKKDIHPVFARPVPVAAKSRQKESGSRGKGTKSAKSNQKNPKFRKEEKDRARDQAKGKGKKGARSMVFDNEPPLDVHGLVCERLDVDAIPWEVGKWLLEASGGDRFFAEQLTDALLESGILAIQDIVNAEKKTCVAVLTDLVSEGPEAAIKKTMESLASYQGPAYRVAGAVLPHFLPQAIQGIQDFQKKKPFHAYQPWREFRAWTRGLRKLSSQAADPLDVLVKERLERLSVGVKDKPDVFRVSKVILTRVTSGAVEKEIQSIWKDAALRGEITKLWELNDGEELSPETVPGAVREWLLTLADKPRKDLYRVKKWGDPGMKELAFDISVLQAKGQNSNFQAIGLYNDATEFGAVSNYIVIPPEDVRRLEELQIEDQYQSKSEDWLRQKMNWLCQYRGSQYMFADEDNYRGEWGWRRPDGIRWGTIALGGNLVQVAETAWLEVKLPSRTEVESVKMAKLKGFRKTDWDRPLDDLLAEGLVHRCFCVHKGNDIGDGPQGIVYSPFWSPEDWELLPKSNRGYQATALWIPCAYLENESIEETLRPPGNSG